MKCILLWPYIFPESRPTGSFIRNNPLAQDWQTQVVNGCLDFTIAPLLQITRICNGGDCHFRYARHWLLSYRFQDLALPGFGAVGNVRKPPAPKGSDKSKYCENIYYNLNSIYDEKIIFLFCIGENSCDTVCTRTWWHDRFRIAFLGAKTTVSST